MQQLCGWIWSSLYLTEQLYWETQHQSFQLSFGLCMDFCTDNISCGCTYNSKGTFNGPTRAKEKDHFWAIIYLRHSNWRYSNFQDMCLFMLQRMHQFRSFDTCSFDRAFLFYNNRGSHDLFRVTLAYTSNPNAITWDLIHSSSMAIDEAPPRFDGKSPYRKGVGRTHENLPKARCGWWNCRKYNMWLEI